jgi:mRNA interferase MazF
MTIYAPGELVLVDFPFVSGAASLVRPALVVLDTGDNDVTLARVTTQSHITSYDLAISDWRGAGLRAPSFIRLHKMVTAEKSFIKRQLGSLRPIDHQHVAAVLQRMFAAW